jgi:hypothetical protein
MLDVAIFSKLVHGDHTSPLVLSKDKKVKITKRLYRCGGEPLLPVVRGNG